jgi:hypothetical protein
MRGSGRGAANRNGMAAAPKPSPLLAALSLNRGELDPEKLAALLARIAGGTSPAPTAP